MEGSPRSIGNGEDPAVALARKMFEETNDPLMFTAEEQNLLGINKFAAEADESAEGPDAA
ncbi:hypothetical protein KW794_00665 [Candidatus Saccharibacteria bacterium]|nr:hypothetical protein [Candidatus Saccharibacteria bacterium]